VLKLAIILGAVLAAALVSVKVSSGTVAHNRTTGWPDPKTEPLSQSEFHWTVVQIRDDIGSIHNLLVLANSIGAGILAALIVRFL
jgi:hypothetical protein